MGFLAWLGQCWSGSNDDDPSTASAAIEPTAINPATGLPMIGGIGSIDVMGNPYGTDLHADHAPGETGSLFDDFPDHSSCSSVFDDPWNNPTGCGSSWDD
jgi:hypothetical protein